MRYAKVSESRVSEMPWQKAGLTWTASGYGARIPTRYMVRLDHDSRWRRVYSVCYGNAASCYVVSRGEKLFLDEGSL